MVGKGICGSRSCVVLKMAKEREETFRDKGNNAAELDSWMSRTRGRTALA